jgi:subtilisin family serine protease
MDARRRVSHLALLTVVVAVCVSPGSVLAAADAVPGELIVKYRTGVTASRRESAESAIPSLTHVRRFDFIGAEHVRFAGMATEEAVARLRASPDVEYAEPNYYIYAQGVPNDPSFSQLWGLQNTGQGGGYAGADIKATQAWDLFTGDPNFLIGVIDTGIDYTHPDLAVNIWTNPGEIPGNGRDDDGNGYVDDVHGYDFVNLDGDPMDDGFHGTHVAGTIGAVGNNGVGVTGVNWRCRMVAIKFMNASGVGTEADAIAAIGYSIVVGCRVTNNSWGNMSGGRAMLDAINAAGAAGQLMVFAAGNNGWNIDLVPFYPPSYVAPNMITVTSTDGRDLRPTLTNYGALTVNLGAPGYNIYSCKPGGLYQFLNGTSMAAPHVTGAVALAMGRLPLATSAQIRQLILTSTDPIPSMNGITTTGGRLNAYKVLLNADGAPPARVTNLAIADTGSTALGLAWTAPGDDSTAGTAAVYDLRTSPLPIDATNFAMASPIVLPPPHVGGSAEIAEVSGLAFNTHYHFALRAIDDFGNPGPVSNDVSATTLGIPTLALSPRMLTLVVPPGAVYDTALVVSNAGQGRLDFRLPAPAPTPWIAATPDSGRIPAPGSMRVALHVDVTGLADGFYDTSLPILGNDPVTRSADLFVYLIVNELTAVGDAPRAPFGLRTISPSPGPRRVTLELSLPTGGPVDVSLFNVHGRRVARLAQGTLGPGVHTLHWDGTDERGMRVGSGVYFARARTREGVSGLRVVIIE